MKTYLQYWTIFCCIQIFSLNLFSQDTLLFQSFESGATNYTLSTPACTSPPDHWGPKTQLGAYFPTHGTNFWGIQDLNGNCGGNSFESISFNTTNISHYNYVELKFKYFYHEFDNGDDIKLNYTLDNTNSFQVILVDGSSNINSTGWLSETIEIPDSVNYIHFSLSIKQNGDNDYAGFDEILIQGVHEDSSYIHNVITDSIICFNNSTPSNALDDYSACYLHYEGQNLSDSLLVNSNYISLDTLFTGQNIIVSQPQSVFYNYTATIQDLHSPNTVYSLNVDSIGHCSNNYNLIIDSISKSNIQVNCFAGDSLDIHISTNGLFHNNNEFEIELQNLNGSPINLYHITNSNLDSVIQLYIPPALDDGTYQINLNSSYPYFSNYSTILQINNPINCKSPHINTVIINACSNGEFEGSGELIFGNTGNYPINLTNNFELYYGSSLNLGGANLKIDHFLPNASNTLALNLTAACPNLFLEGYNQNLPPFSKFIICKDDVDVNSYFWNDLCTQGPIYIFYAQNSTWLNVGIFSNSTSSGIRYIKTKFIDTLNYTHEVINAYERSLNSGNDGDEVVFIYDSIFPVAYSNNNCILTGNYLSIKLLYFTASIESEVIKLNFSLEDEQDFSGYRIEKYQNNSWVNIGELHKKEELYEYCFFDEIPNKTNDYRLIALNINGNEKILDYTAINFEKPNRKIVGRYNLLGQEIKPTVKGYHLIKFKDGSTQLIYKD